MLIVSPQKRWKEKETKTGHFNTNFKQKLAQGNLLVEGKED